MSATNSTTYYELPVFLATDKPAWLTDWNGSMAIIDSAIKDALTAGENAQTTANTATSDIATINSSLTTITTSLTTLTTTVTGHTGQINTINSLIGNGEPTTSDKTLIGAINEIYGMITGGGGGAEIQAQNVVYDNTTSGLTADDVQSAIDELASGAGSGADLDLSAYTGAGTVTSANGTIDNANSDVKIFLNSEKSIAQVAGYIRITTISGLTASAFNTVANITFSDFNTITNEFDVPIGWMFAYANNDWVRVATKLKFKTDGSIDVMVNPDTNTSITTLQMSIGANTYYIDSLGN